MVTTEIFTGHVTASFSNAIIEILALMSTLCLPAGYVSPRVNVGDVVARGQQGETPVTLTGRESQQGGRDG